MSTLYLGNQYSDPMVGDLAAVPDTARRVGGNTALRMLWGVRAGDVLVTPQPVPGHFLDYAQDLLGLGRDAVTTVVPPPGRYGTDVMSPDRLLDSGFRTDLRDILLTRGVEQVVPFYFDTSIARLCTAIGLTSEPGFGFVDQNGGALLNSKSAFRAIAAGVDVPIAAGAVAALRADAEERIREFLADGLAVIVKQDFHVGGIGNEILTTRDDVRPLGASRTVLIDGPAALAQHLDKTWEQYTNAGRNNIVVEHYTPESLPLYAEVDITSATITVVNNGEMRMAPVFDGMAIPGSVTSPEHRTEFLDAVRSLCRPVQAMGYRGLINIDGIVTPDGVVQLTEFNGRLGGSTHLHEAARRLIGPRYAEERLLVTRNHWPVSSFDSALALLRDRGIAFDPARRSGVVIMCDHSHLEGTVEYCVVAEDTEHASRTEKILWDASPGTASP